MDFDWEKTERKPKIEVTLATDDLVKFTLSKTDISVANALRRIMHAEVPTIAIETVNIEENETVIFDEFLAHRMGLLPLSSHGVGDLPVDEGFREAKECGCFDGCPFCTVEYVLDVYNPEDKVLNVTHFDMQRTNRFIREDGQKIELVPKKNPDANDEIERRENGILIAKLKKDQHLRMNCFARKGISKYHGKFDPTATALYRYQPEVVLNRKAVDSLTMEERVEFIQACPRKVFDFDLEDKVQVTNLDDCIFCDECIAKAREFGKTHMVTVKQTMDVFHFIVEAVTAEGPRTAIDVVRASMRIFDWKLQEFQRDAFGDEIKEWLPKHSAY